jgi:elongation factor P
MLSINDLKLNSKIIYNNQPYQVIFVEHSKLGRGGGILRTKLKNLISGTIVEKTFAGAEKIEQADLETKRAEFLFHDNEHYYFQDLDDSEEIAVNKNQVGKISQFLVKGANVNILFFDDRPINLELPIKVKLKVTYTEPGFRGNTASSVLKPATLETGAEIKVPLFIKVGDKIIVDTRTGEYVERR